MQHARQDESSEQKLNWNGSVILTDCKLVQVQSSPKSKYFMALSRARAMYRLSPYAYVEDSAPAFLKTWKEIHYTDHDTAQQEIK